MSRKNVTSACPRLTVAMIVRNEADVLASSLASIKTLADEIVVVDTGSYDGTLELARRLGATVVSQPWSDDFAAARNAAWQAVRGDWLLWLDAGERLDETAIDGLRDFVDSAADRNSVYSLVVQLPALDASLSAEQIAQPRLLPNRDDLRFVGRVRETVLPGVLAAGLSVQLAPGRILRSLRDHDPGRRAARAQRNLTLALREGAETGSMPLRLLLAAGEAHCELGAIDRACETFRMAAEKAAPGTTERLDAYYGSLAALATDAGRADEQLQVCLRALEDYPLDAQLLLTMGHLLQRRDKFDLAARAFDTAVKHGRVDMGTWHLAELPEVATACLAAVLQLRGDDAEAQRVLEEAAGKGDSPRILRPLIDLCIKQGCCTEALALADRLPVGDGELGALHEAVQGACRAAAGDWTAALGHLQIAYLEGCRHPLCLRWLAVTYLANGQFDAARPVLADWRQIEPGNAELQAYLGAVENSDDSPPPSRGNALDGRTLRVDAAEGLPAAAQTVEVRAAW